MANVFGAVFNISAEPLTSAYSYAQNMKLALDALYQTSTSTTVLSPHVSVISSECLASDSGIQIVGDRPIYESLEAPYPKQVEGEGLIELCRKIRAAGIKSAPEQLDGEFSLIIFDTQSKTASCCGDHLGILRLYYASIGNIFLISSSPLCIAVLLGAESQINRRFIANLLSGSSPEVLLESETAFEGVHQLLPGHRLIVEPTGWRVERYWHPERMKAPVRYRDEIRNAVLGTLKQAVLSRIPKHGDLLCDVSGGLDSTAVLHIVAAQLQKESSAGRTIYGRSILHRTTTCFSEDDFIKIALETTSAIHWTEYSEDFPGFDDILNINLHQLPEPSMPILAIPETLVLAKRWNAICPGGVHLSGHGADHVFGNGNLHYLRGLLMRGRVRRFLNHLTQWAESAAVSYWWLLCDEIVRASPKRYQPDQRTNSELFTLECLNLQAKRHYASSWKFNSSTATEHFLHILRGARVVSGILNIGRLCRLNRQFPYLDRRLVELVISLPDDERVYPPLNKQLLRDSLTGIVPKMIREKWAQPSGDITFVRKLKKSAPSVWRDLFPSRLAELNLVKEDGFQQILEHAIQGQPKAINHLIPCFTAEMWLASIYRHLPCTQTNSVINHY